MVELSIKANQQHHSFNLEARVTLRATHLPSQKRNTDGAELIGQGGEMRTNLCDEVFCASILPRVGCEKKLGWVTNRDLGGNPEKYRVMETKGGEEAIKEAVVNIITF